MLMKNFKLITGLLIVVSFSFAALAAPQIAPYLPDLMNWDLEFQGMSASHLLGNDHFGRDILSRLLFGSRISLSVALSTVMISASLGTILGALAAYRGKMWDEAFIFISDILLSFPSILLMIALAAFLPANMINMIAILSFVGWVGFAKVVRAETLILKEKDFIRAAQNLGMSQRRIFFFHLLPNLIGPLVVLASLGAAGIVLAESTLSFLGLGLSPDFPSWGNQLQDGVRFLMLAPHMAFWPGLAIMLLVLALNFLGDALRDRIAAGK